MPISPNLHASWSLCEDITSEPPLGLNHIPMHRRARIRTILASYRSLVRPASARIWHLPPCMPEIEELGWRRPYSAAILKMGEEVDKIEVRREAGKVPCHHGQFARPG